MSEDKEFHASAVIAAARSMREFYLAFRKEGFTEAEALELIKALLLRQAN